MTAVVPGMARAYEQEEWTKEDSPLQRAQSVVQRQQRRGTTTQQ